MEPVHPDLPERTPLPDVSEFRMIEILHAKDPALKAALERLIPLVRSPEVTTAWNNAFDIQ